VLLGGGDDDDDGFAVVDVRLAVYWRLARCVYQLHIGIFAL